MQSSVALEAGFARVKSRFVQKLAHWLPELEGSAARIQSGELPREATDELCARVHKIAGSATMFGLPKLNDRAAELERQLLVLLAEREPNVADVHLALTHFIEQVRLATQAAPATVAAAVPAPISASTYRVLVADDDEHIADVLEHALGNQQIAVVRALDGESGLALAAANATALDAIVLDVNMPKKNGFDVLRALKSDKRTAAIPVIMLTRRDEDENLILGLSSGAVDYILKPFQMDDLARRISTAVTRQRTKILVADDDELIRELLAHRFQRAGYRVLFASTGIDAWQTIQEEKPDLAIVDVMMPGMDGFAVLNKVKDSPVTADIPVIMLTAKGQQENVLLGLEGGAHDYIVKPFDLDELSARVAGILRRSQSARR